MAVLLDTSAILALTNAKDVYHEAVRTALGSLSEPLIAPLPVVPEVDYLIARGVGSAGALAVVQSLVRGDIVIDHLTHADLERAIELMAIYADAAIGFVDSALIALAERLNCTRIVTLDRRHFAFVRPRHCTHVEILP